jgi:hypothetical protein
MKFTSERKAQETAQTARDARSLFSGEGGERETHTTGTERWHWGRSLLYHLLGTSFLQDGWLRSVRATDATSRVIVQETDKESMMGTSARE